MLLSLGAVVLACLLAPAFVIVILSFLIAVQSCFGLMSVLLARRPRETPALVRHAGDGGHGGDVCFSVHVPTHSEPPSVVIATVSALARQIGAPPFEVIVIDNNTADPALWCPVRDWCTGRPNIRFLHREGVDGAKAGALNIALSESRPDATHVVTVDADYVVDRDFLSHAAAALAEWDADFIQFPQAYFGEDHAPGAVLELGDYFLRHARTANGADPHQLVPALSTVGLLACYASALGPLVVAAVGSGTEVPTLRDAILTRIALLPGSALATCKALAGARPGFVVTGKSSAGAARGIPSTVTAAAALGLSVAAMTQIPVTLLGAILLILPLPACLATERSLRTYRARLADNGV